MRSVGGRSAVLLGAGASRDADLPLSGELTRYVVEAIDKDPSTRSLAPVLNQVVSAVQSRSVALGQSPFAATNIERVVSSIRLLANRRTHEVAPFVRDWIGMVDSVDHGVVGRRSAEHLLGSIERALAKPNTPVRRFADSLSGALTEATAPGSGAVFESLDRSVVAAVTSRLREVGDVSYLSPLFDLAASQGSLDVATLNYDLTVETFADARSLVVARGIDGQSKDGGLCWTESGINLYKIHGSVDWRVVRRRTPIASEDVVVAETNRSDRLAVVLGDRDKLEQLPVTLELLHAFALALSRARRLIVVGYSFGDAHVNRLVGRWLDLDPDRVVSILDPSWGSTAQRDMPGADFRRRLGELISPTRPGRSRGHVVRERAKAGLSRIIDEWPSDPADRPMSVAVVAGDADLSVRVEVHCDQRVEGIGVLAGMPGAFEGDGYASTDRLDLIRTEPRPITVMPHPTDITTEMRVKAEQARELTEVFRSGIAPTFRVGPRAAGPPLPAFNGRDFDLMVSVGFVAGYGRHVWRIRDGALIEDEHP